MTSPDDDLKARAKAHVEQLPAETALGTPTRPAGSTTTRRSSTRRPRKSARAERQTPSRLSNRPRAGPPSTSSSPRSQARRTTPVSSRPV
jgi:hypothetical protein